jgi:hypothetical protein
MKILARQAFPHFEKKLFTGKKKLVLEKNGKNPQKIEFCHDN